MCRIQREIEDDLLELGSIAQRRRQIFSQLELDIDLVKLQLAAKELNRFPNDLAKIDRIAPRILMGSHVPDPCDDVAGPTDIGDDPTSQGPYFADVRRFPVEPSQACLSIRRDRCQRLIDLVGD